MLCRIRSTWEAAQGIHGSSGADLRWLCLGDWHRGRNVGYPGHGSLQPRTKGAGEGLVRVRLLGGARNAASSKAESQPNPSQLSSTDATTKPFRLQPKPCWHSWVGAGELAWTGLSDSGAEAVVELHHPAPGHSMFNSSLGKGLPVVGKKPEVFSYGLSPAF